MRPKLLFLFGIVVAHGAVGAALMSQPSSISAAPAASCVQTPAPLPYFEQKAELLAWVATSPSGESMRP
jgi:hypothetical protein